MFPPVVFAHLLNSSVFLLVSNILSGILCVTKFPCFIEVKLFLVVSSTFFSVSVSVYVPCIPSVVFFLLKTSMFNNPRKVIGFEETL